MTIVAPGLRFVDLQFQHAPQIIATAVLDSPGGVALVDPGPASCLPTLIEGLAAGGVATREIRTILLTHIHLDHAGATGTLVREHPHIRVFVHERGAPHVIDPSKLVASASRLYGAAMDTLWGPILPVPAANITTLAGGERIEAAGRRLEVAYTPGHASHHVSYFDVERRIAFVGDVGGIRLPGTTYVLPPTPPPDIDVELWAASIDRIQAWHPAALFLTHFGPVDHPVPHLQQVLERLQRNAATAKSLIDRADGSEADRAAAFVREMHRDLRRELTEVDADRYEKAVAAEHCWMGLARYWQKRAAAPAPRGA